MSLAFRFVHGLAAIGVTPWKNIWSSSKELTNLRALPVSTFSITFLAMVFVIEFGISFTEKVACNINMGVSNYVLRIVTERFQSSNSKSFHCKALRVHGTLKSLVVAFSHGNSARWKSGVLEKLWVGESIQDWWRFTTWELYSILFVQITHNNIPTWTLNKQYKECIMFISCSVLLVYSTFINTYVYFMAWIKK